MDHRTNQNNTPPFLHCISFMYKVQEYNAVALNLTVVDMCFDVLCLVLNNTCTLLRFWLDLGSGTENLFSIFQKYVARDIFLVTWASDIALIYDVKCSEWRNISDRTYMGELLYSYISGERPN